MFSRTRFPRVGGLVVGAGVAAVMLAGCSGGGGGGDGTVEITFQTGNSQQNTAAGEALIEAFEAENPDISVTLDPVPQGTEGDNLIKTRLSTGESDDVFYYNSGSLFQALNPDDTLVDLSDEEWVGDLTDDFRTVVSTDAGLYGAPFGSSFAGGVMYNKTVYADLGLEIPTTWDDFIANSETIKDAGIIPIVQTYGDTWTSQLFVLADFANVEAQQPGWADDYTANEAKYADDPALEGFSYLQQVFEADLLNPDFASATNADGLRMLATGEAAQYPMLTTVIATVQQNNPDQVDDIGYFALPAQNADDTSATIWQPQALYIAKTTTGDKLDAAKRFVAFANSPEGCAVQDANYPVAGPYVYSGCTVPDDAPAIATDVQAYFDADRTAPALEFLSPIKGPNLESIAVQVGSGITDAETGARQYDEDVTKQAQQLGLDGW